MKIITHPLFILLFVLLALYSPAWIWLYKKENIRIYDFIYPFVAPVLWIGLTTLNIGAQSLSNLIEIPIVIGVSFILYLFTLDPDNHHNKKIKIALFFVILLTIAVRVFMPFITE